MDTVHQRQLLERVRTYLVSPDSKLVADKELSSSPRFRPEVVGGTESTVATNQQAVDQIVLAITGEISHLRSELMQPLQEDIQALMQEQEALVQEIQQLEGKRQQQQSLAQQQANQQQIIAEFLQALTISLQETLARGVFRPSVENQWLRGAQATDRDRGSDSSRLEPSQQTKGEPGEMTGTEEIDRKLQLFQANLDRLMTKLDSTNEYCVRDLGSKSAKLSRILEPGNRKNARLGAERGDVHGFGQPLGCTVEQKLLPTCSSLSTCPLERVKPQPQSIPPQPVRCSQIRPSLSQHFDYALRPPQRLQFQMRSWKVKISPGVNLEKKKDSPTPVQKCLRNSDS